MKCNIVFASYISVCFFSFPVKFSHRPWDALEDIEEYEHNGIIKTRTKHPTAPVRSISIHSLLHKNSRADLQVSSKDPTSSQSKGTLSQRAVLPTSSGDSNCSTPEPGELSEVSEKGELLH